MRRRKIEAPSEQVSAQQERPPEAPEPLTPDRIEEAMSRMQHQAEVQAVTQLIQQETGNLAQAKVGLRLAPFGGTPHPGKIREAIEQHSKRLAELAAMRMELEANLPLSSGPGLEVVGGIAVPTILTPDAFGPDGSGAA